MHTGTATSVPMVTMSSGGAPDGASATMTEKAVMQPIITTSPWAKLMSWMIP